MIPKSNFEFSGSNVLEIAFLAFLAKIASGLIVLIHQIIGVGKCGELCTVFGLFNYLT